MKSVLILAVLFLAFGLAGAVDYQTAAAMAAEHSPPAPVLAACGKP